eukprot:659305-Rhodomonas_salina.1
MVLGRVVPERSCSMISPRAYTSLAGMFPVPYTRTLRQYHSLRQYKCTATSLRQYKCYSPSTNALLASA